MSEKQVMAMYDIRGIQNYIFRTAKVKEAMGASELIRLIIMEALGEAVKALKYEEQSDLLWFNESGAIPYEQDDNAYVMFKSRELCLSINQLMANYILDQTYSLQLAVAITSVTGDYKTDYDNIQLEMQQVKANTVSGRPYGALPIMKIEASTGYPATHIIDGEITGTESYKKQDYKKSSNKKEEVNIIDQLILHKGVDSMLAVVHIDGNNIGKQIRRLIGAQTDYTEAINRMRRVSYSIQTSFQNVFDQMYDFFNNKCKDYPAFEHKEVKHFIRKILVAGDDITYICCGKIAMATVEYFCREISKDHMDGADDPDKCRQERFSVCAGVSFARSHFPFSASYIVAEECCGQAKARAKRPENLIGNKIVNFVDYQFCKNIQAKDLESVRRDEYVTCTGETLLRRPYYIHTENDGDASEQLEKTSYSYTELKQIIKYFQNEELIPSSHAAALRNTYSLGVLQVKVLQAFLNSRNISMPDGSGEMYNDEQAKWYDALELMDIFIALEDLEKAVETAK